MVSFEFPAAPDWAWLREHFPRGTGLRSDCDLAEIIRFCLGRLAYMATPYSKLVVNDDGQWDMTLSMDVEMQTAVHARALAMCDITAISPILMACEICHSDCDGYLDPLDNTFWARWCQPLLSRSDVVVVPPMDGWDASNGVWREVCWALSCGVPVFQIEKGEP
jgi:Domain of unknown function (DUF1937)